MCNITGFHVYAAIKSSVLMVSESDQESIAGTPVKKTAQERLQEVKVPIRHAMISLKNTASTQDEAGTEGIGIKTLEHIRREKVEQARKLVGKTSDVLTL